MDTKPRACVSIERQHLTGSKSNSIDKYAFRAYKSDRWCARRECTVRGKTDESIRNKPNSQTAAPYQAWLAFVCVPGVRIAIRIELFRYGRGRRHGNFKSHVAHAAPDLTSRERSSRSRRPSLLAIHRGAGRSRTCEVREWTRFLSFCDNHIPVVSIAEVGAPGASRDSSRASGRSLHHPALIGVCAWCADFAWIARPLPPSAFVFSRATGAGVHCLDDVNALSGFARLFERDAIIPCESGRDRCVSV